MADGCFVAVKFEPAGGDDWAFYFVNDTDVAIRDLELLEVDYEWGDMGNTKTVRRPLGSVAPRRFVLAWRDDSDAAELRMELKFSVRTDTADRTMSFEIPKLYRRTNDEAAPLVGPARFASAARLP